MRPSQYNQGIICQSDDTVMDIKPLPSEDINRYFRIRQNNDICHNTEKKKFADKYKLKEKEKKGKRLKKLMKSKLNSRHLFEAINT